MSFFNATTAADFALPAQKTPPGEYRAGVAEGEVIARPAIERTLAPSLRAITRKPVMRPARQDCQPPNSWLGKWKKTT
jgi:hypothetical protein